MPAAQGPHRRDILTGLAAAACVGWPETTRATTAGLAQCQTCLAPETDLRTVLVALRQSPESIRLQVLLAADRSLVIWQDWSAPEAAGMFWSQHAALRAQPLTRMEM